MENSNGSPINLPLTKNLLMERLDTFKKHWAATDILSTREKESAVLWILEHYEETKSKSSKVLLLQTLNDGFRNSSNTQLSYYTTDSLIQFISEISQKAKSYDEYRTLCSHVLTTECVRNFLKQNEKAHAQLFSNLIGILDVNNSLDMAILKSLSTLYLLVGSNDKSITLFVKKAIGSIALYCAKIMAEHNSEYCKDAEGVLVHLFKSLFFGKTHLPKLKNILESIFQKTEKGKYTRHLALFKSLRNICLEDIDTAAQVQIFRFVVKALILGEQVEDQDIIRFVMVLGWILNVNSEPILDSVHVITIMGAPNTSSSSSCLQVWEGVLQVLSTRSLNLSIPLLTTTGMQWFRQVAKSLLVAEEFGQDHINILTQLLMIDSKILEPSMAQVFTKILNHPEFSTSVEYQKCYEIFLAACMKIYSRLQRINKLISKLLKAVSSAPSNIPSYRLLPATFLDSLSTAITVLPSFNCLNLIQSLLSSLDNCIGHFQEEKLHPVLLQSVGWFLCTVLSGSRLLCYSLPRTVIQSFIQLMETLKNSLGKFGTLILLHAHDRAIMQPFLRMCHVWGEMHALIYLYAYDNASPSLNSDSAPADLSPTLPFLTGDQWSIFTERIANFGDQQCNQLLIKLFIQKLRISSLSWDKNPVYSDATAKLLLEKLKCNVHGVSAVSVMTPQEFSIVLNYLPADIVKMFVQLLFNEWNDETGDFHKWIQDRILLENRRFVESAFEVALALLIESVPESEVPCDLKELYRSLREASSNLSQVSVDNTLRELLNSAFHVKTQYVQNNGERAKKASKALVNLPLGHIATLGEHGLISITAAMVCLNLKDVLLPVFERLLTMVKNVDNCFDVGACIEWLVLNVVDKSTRAFLTELLIIKSTSTRSGLKAFKDLIKHLKKGASLTPAKRLETHVYLHNSIRKCWRRKADPEAVEFNDEIAKQRRRLNKGLLSTLESVALNSKQGQTEWVLLDAYAIELMRMERLGSVGGMIATNFKSFLFKALDGITSNEESTAQSCLNLLTTVLKCSTALRRATNNNNFVLSIWRRLKPRECPGLWQHVCTAASEKEFAKIMKELLTHVQSGLEPPEHEQITWDDYMKPPEQMRPLFLKLVQGNNRGQWCNFYIDVWMLFLQKATGDKLKCCHHMVRQLINQPQNILPCRGAQQDALLTWLRFLHFLITHPSVPGRSELEDYVFDVLLATTDTGSSFLDHFTVHVDILCALVAPQKVLKLQKVPLIFQVFQKLLRWLIRESSTTTSRTVNEASARSSAAFHVEKWTGLFVKRKEAFRVIPQFVSEIVFSLSTVTLLPPVKMHLHNALFNMLGVSDEHSVKYLRRTLPPGCQQVFNNIYSEFQKFHRYKGKI